MLFIDYIYEKLCVIYMVELFGSWIRVRIRLSFLFRQ